MEKLLVFMMILVSVLSLWVKDVEIFIMDRGYRTVQYSIEHAVHDGALQVDTQALADGNIIFIPTLAEEKIRESLRMNLSLDTQLRPNSLTLLDAPVTIDDIVYIDDNYIDPMTGIKIVFPTNWEYTLPDGRKFERAIFGPSIAMVLDVKVKGAEEHMKKFTIQEYKGEFLQN
ncbi:hypothetical protein [Psychrobacillus sp. FSL H8-0487]|uniref:hypothetical protein n=1 Tax=Psychrobacillus sp. FSL H8-0487 TaxID=2921391 RepID=UPI0030F7283D